MIIETENGTASVRQAEARKRIIAFNNMLASALLASAILSSGCAPRFRIAPDRNQPGIEVSSVENVKWASLSDKGFTIKATAEEDNPGFMEVTIAFSNLTNRQFSLEPTAVKVVGVTDDDELTFKTWSREEFISKTRSDYANHVAWRSEAQRKELEEEKDPKKRQELLEGHQRRNEEERIAHGRRIDYLQKNLLERTTIGAGDWVQGSVMVGHGSAVKYRVEIPISGNLYRINFVSVKAD
jgi:hypothetical protein